MIPDCNILAPGGPDLGPAEMPSFLSIVFPGLVGHNHWDGLAPDLPGVLTASPLYIGKDATIGKWHL